MLLIFITAIFVALEFAIVKTRPSKIEQLKEEGKKNTKHAYTIVTHVDEYLSACQLGITITALALGWIGEPAVTHMLEPLIQNISFLPEASSRVISIVVSFAIVTYINVVVGELAPKTVAIQKSEHIVMIFAMPLVIFYYIMYPFIRLLNGSARLLLRMFGMKDAYASQQAHTEEEIKLLLSESFASGEINQRELNYVNNIFDFDERLSREIMLPRTKMDFIDLDDTRQEIIDEIVDSKHTRYPVMRDGDKDDIIGIVNIKEYLIGSMKDKGERHIKDYIYPPLMVIESTPIHDLLLLMQRKRVHIAILLDEYGGTSGMVTIEDIIEEIVGEIRDEFDSEEISDIQIIGTDHYLVSGVVLVEDINELLGIEIEDDSIDSIGGWMLTQQYEIKEGQVITYDNYIFKVSRMDGHQVDLIDITKNKESSNN